MSSFVLNIAVMVLNIATGILMARWLGPYGRGEFAAATRWAGLLVGLSAVGLPGAIIYLGKQYRERQRELFGAYLLLGMGFGLLGLLIGEMLLPFLMGGQSKELLQYARIAMLCLPFAVLTDGLIGTLQSLNLFRKVMFLRLMSPIGSLAVIGGLAFAGRIDVPGLIWWNTVLWGLFTFLITLVWVYRTLRPKLSGLKDNVRQLFRNGVKIYGGSLVSIFGGNFDQLVLSLALSPYALGLYAVASSVGGILPSVVFGALNVFLWPKLMDLPREQRQRKVERIHALLFYGTSGATLIGAALLPFALPLLYGHEYEPAVWMGMLMLAAAPVRIGCTVLLNYLNTEGKFHTVSLSEAVSVGTGFAVMMALLSFAGEEAAAIGIVAATVVKWLFVWIASRKLGIRFGALFVVHWREDLHRLSSFRKTQKA
ncbi:lipopolysaccharide biosynthesis protein [Cohnella faecalis]|nr:lipopolysaccharide biosynthesis protein [Cohnella faecalis]